VPSCEHEAGISSDQWFGVGMKVAEHGVATPAPDNTDFFRRRAMAPLARRERAAILVGSIPSGVAWYGEGRDAEDACDHGGGDGAFLPVSSK